MMNEVIRTIQTNTDGWFKHYIELLSTHPMPDVLEYLYSPDKIEIYLEEKRKQLTFEILEWLKHSKKYIYTETGEKLIVDDIFIESNFELQLNRRQFKSKLLQGKFSIERLIFFNKTLNDENIFRKID
ncbi:MAG: hypothetical protein BM557_01165 [Flavobacterium sp. MedPE-SWcel]|uniref:hypothetical protein n=1 Tax=uncultured Flavobacterium sp. TaxID=165435 RepID=UPI00090F6459|nr:hypothetical protein [uncultured Flavobacterium sp.]OIQ22017.1 MAG: hypothetical protein BM557_01165 [Flavobacterium sp. MedPE-SWcel]